MAKASEPTKEELIARVAQLEKENKNLNDKLQKFEDFLEKVKLFMVQLEELVPQKLLGWFRWIIMGFVTMKAIIDTIQEFTVQLEAWKNRNEPVLTDTQKNPVNTAIVAGRSLVSKVK